MRTDKNVNINFKTTADTKGAKKVEKEIKEVGLSAAKRENALLKEKIKYLDSRR